MTGRRTDRELLAEYAGSRSEAAFAELVRRHAGKVHAAAVRILGDPHAAEDVSQAAFLLLARRAARLGGREAVSGWLLKTASFVAAHALRERARRARREEAAVVVRVEPEMGQAERAAAWREMAPHIDAALAELPSPCRDAVVLRHMDGLSGSEAARELGVSEGAVAKRLQRGLEGLRAVLVRRCVALSAASVAALLAEHAVGEVPVGLVTSIQAACSGAAVPGAASVKMMEGTMKAMMWTKVKLAAAVVGAVLTVGGGGGVVVVSLAAGGEPAAKPTEQPTNQWVKAASPVTLGPTAWITVPGQMVNAQCHDSKRKQTIVTQPRKMQAIDLADGAPVDLKAKTVIDGEEFPGGPPLEGALTCYDPVNDEILLFSHWTKNMINLERGPDPRLRNFDRIEVDGVTSGHFGTLRFSFTDNTWRRVGETFGSDEAKKARKALFELMAKTSKATDGAWVLRRSKDGADAAQVKSLLAEAAGAIEGLALPAAAKSALAPAIPLVKEAAAAAADAKWDATLRAGGMALWHMNNVIEQTLRVEPPPRCAAPMVYDPGRKVIVMFGGSDGLVRTDLMRATGPGTLNDTWVYDCATRQWREVAGARRPPAQMRPAIFYDPASRLIVLVTFESAAKTSTARLWTLDLDKGEWSLRAEQPWPGTLPTTSGQGSEYPKARTPVWGVGFGAERGQVVFGQDKETYVLQLDLSKLPSQPAPEWTAPAPVKPQVLPPDDPAWLAKLKELPANQWVAAKPQPELWGSRDWGNLACDPVRGLAVYFGGGHSTYQVNDVAIYAPGANRWSFAAGDHNSLVPPNAWDGIAVGFRGGANAQHQRNIYQALDGRMYTDIGGANKEGRYGGSNDGTKPGPRYTWFYDVDRGGLWRRQRAAEATKVNGADGFWGRPQLSSPDGRLFGMSHDRSAGAYVPLRPNFYVTIYDANRNTVECRKTAGDDFPVAQGESRPFCFLPDKDQIFYVGASYKAKDKILLTWVYDVKTNAWTNLQAKDQPTSQAFGVEYVVDQKAVWAATKDGQFLYSLETNAWRPLGDTKARIGGPYAQVAYVAKYGVLVSVPKRVMVMRVDAAKLSQ